MGQPRPLFRPFKQTLQFLQQINVKNVHPVYSARIPTHDLWNMSLLLKPLDQGSRPLLFKFGLFKHGTIFIANKFEKPGAKIQSQPLDDESPPSFFFLFFGHF